MRALQEGAAEPLALLGLIRLVHYLTDLSDAPFDSAACDIIVDSGTGVTATGGLPADYTVHNHLQIK